MKIKIAKKNENVVIDNKNLHVQSDRNERTTVRSFGSRPANKSTFSTLFLEQRHNDTGKKFTESEYRNELKKNNIISKQTIEVRRDLLLLVFVCLCRFVYFKLT